MNEFNSKHYWERRYIDGHTSGVGSRGELAIYKAKVINNFIKKNKIKSLCEFGCGDFLFNLIKVSEFTGYDVSDYVIEKNKLSSKYKFTSNLKELTAYDLVTSLDVIFHLIEDDVYISYMDFLFKLSKKYVIIYSPNENKEVSIHVKYRKFLNNISNNFKLKKFINNPHKGELTQSDFYIFEKK